MKLAMWLLLCRVSYTCGLAGHNWLVGLGAGDGELHGCVGAMVQLQADRKSWTVHRRNFSPAQSWVMFHVTERDDLVRFSFACIVLVQGSIGLASNDSWRCWGPSLPDPPARPGEPGSGGGGHVGSGLGGPAGVWCQG